MNIFKRVGLKNCGNYFSLDLETYPQYKEKYICLVLLNTDINNQINIQYYKNTDTSIENYKNTNSSNQINTQYYKNIGIGIEVKDNEYAYVLQDEVFLSKMHDYLSLVFSVSDMIRLAALNSA